MHHGVMKMKKMLRWLVSAINSNSLSKKFAYYGNGELNLYLYKVDVFEECGLGSSKNLKIWLLNFNYLLYKWCNQRILTFADSWNEKE